MLEDQTIEAPRERDTANRTNEVQAERARAVAVTQRVEHTGRAETTRPRTAVRSRHCCRSWASSLVAFLVIGLALPVLPLHVHQGLGLSTFVVGLVTGSQFAASLISRVWSGHYADSKGAKRAVVVGLLTAVAGGLLYLLSLAFVGTPLALRHDPARRPGAARRSGELCYHGRGELGACPRRSREHRTRHCLGRDGDVRRPCVRGSGRHHALCAWRIHRRRRRDDLVSADHRAARHSAELRSRFSAGAQSGLMKVLGAVWLPGFGSALSTVGFGAMIAFSSLLSAERGWSPVWLTFSAFAIALGRGPSLPRSHARQDWAAPRSRWFACSSKRPVWL